MASLKQEALNFVSKQTKNVAELPQVAVDSELMTGHGTDDQNKTFEYKYLEFNGVEYRVPGVVIGQIKDLVEMNPNLKFVKVKRTGEGLKTRYTVMPMS
jgi:hypothetical protein